jgi:hypothetical protein
MAFARSVVAGVACVTVAFILDNEFGGCESRFQRRANLKIKSHYFAPTPSIPACMA